MRDLPKNLQRIVLKNSEVIIFLYKNIHKWISLGEIILLLGGGWHSDLTNRTDLN